MQKTVIIALAVIGTLTAGYLLCGGQPSQTAASPDAVKDVYNQWKVNYKINVGAAEDDYRFGVFSKNYGKINQHNRLLGRSYSLGLNAFTHLTQEEFAATHLGFKAPAVVAQTNVTLPLKNLKTKVDWSEKMNAVKNQGQCGSCWAFSAVGAIEGAHAAINGKLFNLAEQELVDCAGGDYGNQGCNGGLMDQAFAYVKAVGGLATQDEYPYKAADGTCIEKIETRQGQITGFTDVKVSSSDALKAALSQQPVAVAIEADTFTFQGYSGGVINDDTCGTQLDHGVVAVGFNDEDKIPYYKVRNSWGASWGEAGHVRLAIVDGPGMCGIQMAASYPTL
jgi:hypothetical protein